MGKKILVVDDDPVVRVLVNEFLSSSGHCIEVLESGTECLEHLSRDVPDVLILDLMMPDMTGLEVLKNIRKNSATKTLPVIMLSASMEQDDILEQADVKPDSFVEKPFKAGTILEAVDTILNQ